MSYEWLILLVVILLIAGLYFAWDGWKEDELPRDLTQKHHEPVFANLFSNANDGRKPIVTYFVLTPTPIPPVDRVDEPDEKVKPPVVIVKPSAAKVVSKPKTKKALKKKPTRK